MKPKIGLNLELVEVLKSLDAKDMTQSIPRFDHIVDCFNDDPKWSEEKLSLDKNYIKNVESCTHFMKINGYNYLQLIDFIHKYD